MVQDTNLCGELAVVATLKIRADKLEDFRQAVAEAAVATREEPGCFLYEVHADPADPECFVLLERWADKAALDEHLALPHAKAFMTALPGCLAGPPQIRRFAPLKF